MRKLASQLKTVRGTADWFPEQLRTRRELESRLVRCAEKFGFQPVETPLLEYSSLFERSLGDGSDVVAKEMFELACRNEGGPLTVLRPENTAAIMRAALTKQAHVNSPGLFYYLGPQFRYERPQKGRLRQFHQFGVEHMGSGDVMADVECILCGVDCLKALGVGQSRYVLKLNSLGARAESRSEYMRVLEDHLVKWSATHELSKETLQRIHEKRFLRVLDSKSPQDALCIQSAPDIAVHLPSEDMERFRTVVETLKGACELSNVQVDSHLVRGLDYYCHTCFEFIDKQTGLAILAGGRYDHLASELSGGKIQVPAIGWAMGIERLVELAGIQQPANQLSVLVVPLYDAVHDDEIATTAINLSSRLRTEDISARVAGRIMGSSAMKKALREAERLSASFCCIVGWQELETGQVSVRDMRTGHVVRKNLNDHHLANWF